MRATRRGDDLDTRLLRAMVIKGILEKITTNTVNLVNADLLAKTRGLRIIESTVPAEGRSVLQNIQHAVLHRASLCSSVPMRAKRLFLHHKNRLSWSATLSSA